MKIANNEITESQLRESVMQHLGWFPEAVSKDMGVSFSDGIVTLTGVVDTYAERLAAEHAVKALYGVKGIANEIQVRQLSTLNDTDIARNAVHAIESQALVPEEQITVTVSEGWVKLEGRVEWMYEKKMAEVAVRNLLGVRGVFNEIEIEPRINPEWVKERIEAALRRSGYIDAINSKVEPEDRKVSLSGVVRSLAEKENVELAAWAAPGIAEVETDILVSS
jgi:osmotically-inducible protein OsmY